jgi:hypothetical protein
MYYSILFAVRDAKKTGKDTKPPAGWLVQCELVRIADTALNAGIVIHIACNALQPRIQGEIITDGRVITRAEDTR